MEIIKLIMGSTIFLLGIFVSISGLYIILRREYYEAVKTLAGDAPKLVNKSPVEDLVKPLAASSVQLMETVNKLIQTAVGVGAFLLMIGPGLCVVAYWMVSNH